jgi:hypothetical protein
VGIFHVLIVLYISCSKIKKYGQQKS